MVQSLKIPDLPITNDLELNNRLQWLVKTLQEDFPTMMAFDYYQTNVAASQTNVELYVLGGLNTRYVMPFNGSVRAISIMSNDDRSAGTLTVDITINNNPTGIQAILDGTNTRWHWGTGLPETATFVPGDRLGIDITTTADWAPTTADIVVEAFVIM